MQMLRGLAVLACVVLGMSGAARADWLDDARAAYARGDHRTFITIVKPRAEQGNARAQTTLALMYYDGLGVAQDYKTAMKWFTLAAEQGLADAQNNLGHMYENGEGVAQDYKAAAKWYTLAAEQGSTHAQGSLGAIYHNGYGVVQDYVKAHMWFNISASGGVSKSSDYRDFVAAKMTPIQIAKAQELATKCVAQSFKNCGS